MKFLAFVLVASAGAAHAQYKCTAPDGSTAYQQTPCAAGAVEKVIAKPSAGVPASWPWIEPSRPAGIRKAFVERRFAVGMTIDEVYRMAGEPSGDNTTTSARGTSHQLVYRTPRTTFYVYVDEFGLVTSIQESGRYQK